MQLNRRHVIVSPTVYCPALEAKNIASPAYLQANQLYRLDSFRNNTIIVFYSLPNILLGKGPGAIALQIIFSLISLADRTLVNL